jgi:hypothetical protein
MSSSIENFNLAKNSYANSLDNSRSFLDNYSKEKQTELAEKFQDIRDKGKSLLEGGASIENLGMLLKGALPNLGSTRLANLDELGENSFGENLNDLTSSLKENVSSNLEDGLSSFLKERPSNDIEMQDLEPFDGDMGSAQESFQVSEKIPVQEEPGLNRQTVNETMEEDNETMQEQPVEQEQSALESEGFKESDLNDSDMFKSPTQTDSLDTGVKESTSEGEDVLKSTTEDVGEDIGEDLTEDVGEDIVGDVVAASLIGVSEAIPIVGGLVALGYGLYDVFSGKNQQQGPQLSNQDNSSTSVSVVPSFDSVQDENATSAAF